MSPDRLQRWLAELERRHPRSIELGLERVGRVWRRLGSPRPARRVITVAGTNGKGSTVAFAEAAARAMGWRVGAYTSPHLLRYNERIRIDGTEAADDDIADALDRVEAARGEVALTYFEAGTLAALLLLAEAGLDLALLEVGLGGRLDAVNLIDADVAVVTTVALDHQDWLGDTRAAIAREKAGIARPGRPLLVGERDVEPMLLSAAQTLGARVLRLGRDFGTGRRPRSGAETAEAGASEGWFADHACLELPARLPLAAPVQHDNAATALAALHALAGIDVADGVPAALRYELSVAAAGLAEARLPGRLQNVACDPPVWLDVGHNPQAAQVLASWLAGQDAATDAVFSALSDKDIEGIVQPLRPWIRHWHLAGLDGVGPRGLTAGALADRVRPLLSESAMSTHADVATALSAARRQAGPDGQVLVFGSFLTVAQAQRALDASPAQAARPESSPMASGP